MPEREAVLFANEAFYMAFLSQDFGAMDDVWSRGAPVTCIHPGWSMIVGREPVLDSWRGIFDGGNAPAIACRAPRAFIYGDSATVLCFEDVGGGYLIATNMFVREDRGWKMVHHQAGATNGVPPDEEPRVDKIN